MIYGKVHFISIFLLSSFFAIFNMCMQILRHSDLSASINFLSIAGMLWGLFLDHFKTILEHPSMYFTGLFLGIGCISSFGEYYLGGCPNSVIMNPDKRNLMQVGDKLPSDFEVITWNNGIKNNLKNISNIGGKLISIRCVTKSCRLVEDICKTIYAPELFQPEDNDKDLSSNLDCPFRIIKCPDPIVYGDLERSVNNAPVAWSYTTDKNIEYNRLANMHKERVRLLNQKLDKFIKTESIKINSYYLGNWKFAIFEFEGHHYKMVIINSDKSVTRPSRIGLYTESSFVIKTFVDNFDSIWENINLGKEIGKRNLDLKSNTLEYF